MTEQEIKQVVEDYFNQMFAKDADYLDHITDSWIFDAEDWFKAKFNITDWNAEETHWFIKFANDRFAELYGEKYGERDAKLHLHFIIGEIFNLKGEFEKYKPYFKTFPTYNDVVSEDFKNLLEHLKLLNDIENGKIESLKKGE